MVLIFSSKVNVENTEKLPSNFWKNKISPPPKTQIHARKQAN